ncbi:MAG: Gfo/Idh/MocA family protein, partial [Rhodoferax sp.]
IGRAHLSAYQQLPHLFEVTAVCDLQAQRLEDSGVAWTTTQIQDLLDSDKVDLLDICTPPNTHLELIRRAIAAGKHVVCEKPLVGSLAEADEVESLLANASARLFPIFQYRFGEGLQKLMHLRSKGFCRHALMTTIETHWRRDADYYATQWRGKWAAEMGGVCLTQAIHAHDILTYVLGPIKTVYSRLATRVNDIEGEDCAAISLEMCDGSLAVLSATLGAAVESSRLKFIFQDMTVESGSAHPYRPASGTWVFKGKTQEIDAKVQAALGEVASEHESFEGQFVHIHAALCSDAATPVSMADARASLDLITAIYHSGETGTAVALPIQKGHPKYTTWVPATGGFPKAVAHV